jgi:hypothetical protein
MCFCAVSPWLHGILSSLPAQVAKGAGGIFGPWGGGDGSTAPVPRNDKKGQGSFAVEDPVKFCPKKEVNRNRAKFSLANVVHIYTIHIYTPKFSEVGFQII